MFQSQAFTQVEDSVEKIVQESIIEVEQGSEAVAVVNATAEAIGEAVASAFSDSETIVEVEGDGEAEARAESQAASFANATATAIIDAFAGATDGNSVAVTLVRPHITRVILHTIPNKLLFALNYFEIMLDS